MASRLTVNQCRLWVQIPPLEPGFTFNRERFKFHIKSQVITKIIKNQINLVPAGRREFKPVETMKSVVDESGRLHSLDCN